MSEVGGTNEASLGAAALRKTCSFGRELSSVERGDDWAKQREDMTHTSRSAHERLDPWPCNAALCQDGPTPVRHILREGLGQGHA